MALVVCLPVYANALELTGYLSAEGSLFIDEPLYTGQEQNAGSGAGQVEFYHELESGSSFTATVFARADSADNERSHADLREFNFLYLGDGWELRTGVGKVFWGVTEFSHLVDIVNQSDGVESIDGEEKLGQPMLHLSVPADIGTFDFFILPGFRERTFPGEKGRLRYPLVVDTSNATYENADEECHIDFAVRYSHTIGDWDIGLSHFSGTGRDPQLRYKETIGVAPVLVPHYIQIQQSGVDLQLMAGDFIWKLEAIHRSWDGDSYTAADIGFEYFFYGVFDSGADIGTIVEYLYDDRGRDAETPYNNDITLGLRLALNDVDSTELLTGLVQDLDTSARAVVVEGSRRFGDSIRSTLEAGAFLDAPETDPLYGFRNDSYLKLEAAWYF